MLLSLIIRRLCFCEINSISDQVIFIAKQVNLIFRIVIVSLYILAPYLFIICLDYLLRMSIDIIKDSGFKPAKEKSRRYPAQTTDVDIALLINIPIQAKSLLHCLERAAVGRGLHVNTDKTEYMCFNQRGNISTLNSNSLKLVDNFLLRKQRLINQERDQHVTSKGMDSYD